MRRRGGKALDLEDDAGGPTPLGMRLLHAAVFLAFSVFAVLGTRTEWAQWIWAWSGPWHSGTPPFWPAVAGALLAAGGGAVLAVRLAQRREVSLYVSGAILLGFMVSLSANAAAPARRSVEGGNAALLGAARGLQRAMGQQLQAKGELPNDAAEWQVALDTAALAQEPPGSPYRDRAFRAVPLTVHLLGEDAWSPQGQPPGTVAVWLSRDRAQFTLRLLGISADGRAALLLDDRGTPINLRGVFNPDMQPGQAR